MKLKTTLAVLALCIAGSIAAYASDPNVGSWKLNDAKSKVPAGAPKNNTVTYTAAGDQLKCVVDGVDGKGQPSHNEWTGKFDGKDYPVVGDNTADARSIQKIGDRKYKLANKKGGKVTLSGTIEISADGKTRTLTIEGAGADGKKMTSTQVYDKQ
ncbi:hypothetical protein Acid345_1452 [Candidatus Koribacter versatilis Ellin345]|uniref:Lipocalin-like domain-containing protein n=1 Tax=Koribacter versatilis (strain Ellin345) TaxID=204669 RepID=Q1IRP6_KORVE|nr:hypothetical protein [Candidatus Koribacter versatilis]ABF40454.1 hypothetical protein Acid345_1452 [Candidatus Koribacter versatilis Ellin345]